MNKIHLKDLPERGVYLKFDDVFAKEFFGTFMNNFDADATVKRLGFKSGIELIRNYRRNKSSYSLFLVKKISQSIQKIDRKFSLNNLENCIVEIMAKKVGNGGRLGGSIRNPRHPFVLNQRTTRLISHTLCDGDIHPSGRLRYTNKDYQLIQAFISDLGELGKVEYKDDYDSGAYRLYVPKIVKIVLDKLGMEDDTHQFILRTNHENKIVFIQAAFDDEGTINLSGLRLSMNSIDKQLLIIIKQLLKEFTIISSDIKPRNSYKTKNGKERQLWFLEVSGFKNFKKFYNLTKLQHSEKKRKLKKLIEWYKGKKVRPLRGETTEKILSMLKGESLTIYQLSRHLKIKPRTIYGQIRKLALNNQVYPVKRIKRRNQKTILWSTEPRKVLHIYQFDHEQFSRKLLKLLEKPKKIEKLAKIFDRTKGNILYHLNKLKKKNLVKCERAGKETLWVRSSYNFSRIEKLSKQKKKIIKILRRRQMTAKEIAKIVDLNIGVTRHHLYELERLHILGSRRKYRKLWFVI